MTSRLSSLFVTRLFLPPICAAFVALCLGGMRPLPAPGQPSASAAFAQGADAAAVFLKLFDLLDKDRDGTLPLGEIFDALDLQQAEARQVKRVRALDRNDDGKVTRDEAVAGVKAEIEYQTRRGMNTDADGDGELTPAEHALAIPDPDGKADASGLTPLQQRGFKENDLDGNGRLTRAETETRLNRAYAGSYWALTMAVRARHAAGNPHGAIGEEEFALLEGLPAGQPIPEEIRKRFQMAGAKDGKLGMQGLQLFFVRMNETERVEAEKRMAAFEARANASRKPEGERKQ